MVMSLGITHEKHIFSPTATSIVMLGHVGTDKKWTALLLEPNGPTYIITDLQMRAHTFGLAEPPSAKPFAARKVGQNEIQIKDDLGLLRLPKLANKFQLYLLKLLWYTNVVKKCNYFNLQFLVLLTIAAKKMCKAKVDRNLCPFWKATCVDYIYLKKDINQEYYLYHSKALVAST